MDSWLLTEKEIDATLSEMPLTDYAALGDGVDDLHVEGEFEAIARRQLRKVVEKFDKELCLMVSGRARDSWHQLRKEAGL